MDDEENNISESTNKINQLCFPIGARESIMNFKQTSSFSKSTLIVFQIDKTVTKSVPMFTPESELLQTTLISLAAAFVAMLMIGFFLHFCILVKKSSLSATRKQTIVISDPFSVTSHQLGEILLDLSANQDSLCGKTCSREGPYKSSQKE